MHILTKFQKIFIITLIIGYILFSTVCLFTSIYLPYNLLVQGQKLNGIKLTDLKTSLDQIENSHLNGKHLILEYKEHTFSFPLTNLGIYSNLQQVEMDILGIYDKKFVTTMYNFLDIFVNSKEYKFKYRVHRESFLTHISDIASLVSKQPIDAEFRYMEGIVTIVEEVNGEEVDTEKLIWLIENSEIHSDHLVLELPLRDVIPEITSFKLAQMGIDEIIGEFTTEFDSNLINRTNNLRLATSAINGKILAPGEMFSFNETVGQRTIIGGYKASPIYVGDSIRDGVGGGICQVSSTIYNAVLFADLKVIERRNHSLTVPYVELSRDATVSWDNIDFKFMNNTDSYIYIYGNIENAKLTFELHGTKTDKIVQLKSERLSTIPSGTRYIFDEHLTSGKEIIVERGKPGYTSRLIKEIYIDEDLIQRQVVSTDRYLPTITVIKKGT